MMCIIMQAQCKWYHGQLATYVCRIKEPKMEYDGAIILRMSYCKNYGARFCEKGCHQNSLKSLAILVM